MNRKREISARSLLWAIALAALATAACTSRGAVSRASRPTVKPGEFGVPACFYRSLVRDFQVLDLSNLVVYAPTSADAFHVHVMAPSEELRSADAIAFSSTGGDVCGHVGETLSVAGTGGSGLHFIDGVYRLDPPALSGLLSRFGIEKRPVKPDSKPAAQPPIERELGEPAPK